MASRRHGAGQSTGDAAGMSRDRTESRLGTLRSDGAQTHPIPVTVRIFTIRRRIASITMASRRHGAGQSPGDAAGMSRDRTELRLGTIRRRLFQPPTAPSAKSAGSLFLSDGLCSLQITQQVTETQEPRYVAVIANAD